MIRFFSMIRNDHFCQNTPVYLPEIFPGGFQVDLRLYIIDGPHGMKGISESIAHCLGKFYYVQ